MKLFIIFFVSFSFLSFAQQNSPIIWDQLPQSNSGQESNLGYPSKAIWDVQFSKELTTIPTVTNLMVGVTYLNNEFWVSKFLSDTIIRFSSNGSLIYKHRLFGLTGTRAITTDGTYLYLSNNTDTIYRVDPTTKQLAPPHIPVVSTNAVHAVTYDNTLNGGLGGFWTINVNSNFESLDMNGNSLSVIPFSTHNITGAYGMALDNITAGGPYLWVYSHSGANNCLIIAVQLPSGTPTSIFHDSYSDFSVLYNLTPALGGGLFISTDFVPGTVSLIGIEQGLENVLFAYEISSIVGLNDLKNNKPEVIRITDIMGRDTKVENNKVLLYYYSDGTMKKKYFYD